MTEFENKLVEKILEKIDMDKLTDKIAERAAELIIQKENPSSPVIPPIPNGIPWTTPPYDPNNPIAPVTVMYGVTPVEFRPWANAETTGNVSTLANQNVTEKKEEQL